MGIVKDLATEIAITAPKAFVLVISSLVSFTIPIVTEVFKRHGVFDPKQYALHLPFFRLTRISTALMMPTHLLREFKAAIYGGLILPKH